MSMVDFHLLLWVNKCQLIINIISAICIISLYIFNWYKVSFDYTLMIFCYFCILYSLLFNIIHNSFSLNVWSTSFKCIAFSVKARSDLAAHESRKSMFHYVVSNINCITWVPLLMYSIFRRKKNLNKSAHTHALVYIKCASNWSDAHVWRSENSWCCLLMD